MLKEEYEWNKKELLKHKNIPYMFSNEPLAIEFYEELKREYPSASIHCYDIHQWICFNDKAREAMRITLANLLFEHADKMSQLVSALRYLNEKEGQR